MRKIGKISLSNYPHEIRHLLPSTGPIFTTVLRFLEYRLNNLAAYLENNFPGIQGRIICTPTLKSL